MADIQEQEANRIKTLEQSLVNYLMDKREVVERSGVNSKKIRNLTLRFDCSIEEHPIFIVQIGILESEFDLQTGVKEKGSCYGLERYIREWAERESIKAELISISQEGVKPVLKVVQNSKLTDNIGFLI